MGLVGQLARNEPADGIDFVFRDLSRLSIEYHEAYGAVGTKRFVIAAVVVHVDKKIVLEERFIDDLVAIAPAPADFVRWKKRFNLFFSQFLKNLFFVARAGIQSVPMRHTTSNSNDIFPLSLIHR